MIVGEAPGYLGADRTGVPFTGDRSGRRVQKLLIALGMSEETDPAVETPRLRGVWLTNVVR
ncbi:MAG: uracil-DNA glycosylase, partial [Anaerolineae bacterium]|nr:uracil-DNA glycosylase [Anaerolineae bacterium]